MIRRDNLMIFKFASSKISGLSTVVTCFQIVMIVGICNIIPQKISVLFKAVPTTLIMLQLAANEKGATIKILAQN